MVEDYLFSYVTVGREVIRFGERKMETGGAIIVVDPDYDLAIDNSNERKLDQLANKEVSSNIYKTSIECSDRDSVQTNIIRQLSCETNGVSRLPGTRQEGEKVKMIIQNKT